MGGRVGGGGGLHVSSALKEVMILKAKANDGTTATDSKMVKPYKCFKDSRFKDSKPLLSIKHDIKWKFSLGIKMFSKSMSCQMLSCRDNLSCRSIYTTQDNANGFD